VIGRIGIGSLRKVVNQKCRVLAVDSLLKVDPFSDKRRAAAAWLAGEDQRTVVIFTWLMDKLVEVINVPIKPNNRALDEVVSVELMSKILFVREDKLGSSHLISKCEFSDEGCHVVACLRGDCTFY
jgi:hypothetical protein